LINSSSINRSNPYRISKMETQVVIDHLYKWKEHTWGDFKVRHIGSEKTVRDFEQLLPVEGDLDRKVVSEGLSGIVGNFAAIVEGQRWILAVVDKIRSYPVFYMERGGSFCISNSARLLKEKLSLCEIDDISLLEFRMAGYVTGWETLYKFLYQLQAGEWLLWDKTNRVLERERYYLFYSEETRRESEDELIDELDQITNRIFRRIIEKVNGAPIWIPLSGGLDSRLVLCKLKQLGYDNLTAFSYGAYGNYEAKAAKHVAKKIGVPWQFVPISMKESKKFFYADTRKKYWVYSDGLSNIPNMQDIHALSKLLEQKRLSPECVIINGQSGDFITGGHIPSSFLDREPDISLLFERAIDKHYSLWVNLKTKENVNKIVNKIKDLLDIDGEEKLDLQGLARLYECWEWQERQCKYVINGQRIYDFFHLKWFLPLWDDNYLKFWEKIGVRQKYAQRLYKYYLERFDFFGLFKTSNPEIWRWPGITIGLVPIARVIKLLFGRRYSDLFYTYSKYFGHSREFYAPYSLRYFLGRARQIRGGTSLNIETWMMENLKRELV
jgi:asparagine synthase (glutamine-hydrolysing)